jgi:uracil-DNA glycosylase
MILDDILKLFEEKIFSASLKDGSLFNQYNDKNLEIDLPDADKIRQDNLRNYLRSFTERPSVIVIGEAPGWRGCRFSGVPFTSEFQLCDNDLPFTGNQSSRNESPYKESTATIFWNFMSDYHTQFFAWNCIPFHPYKSDNPLSNRTPTTREISTYLALLSEIVSFMQPSQIVAVGKSAERSLKNLGIPFSYVRHPSHGGAYEFRIGMERVFREK